MARLFRKLVHHVQIDPLKSGGKHCREGNDQNGTHLAQSPDAMLSDPTITMLSALEPQSLYDGIMDKPTHFSIGIQRRSLQCEGFSISRQ